MFPVVGVAAPVQPAVANWLMVTAEAEHDNFMLVEAVSGMHASAFKLAPTYMDCCKLVHAASL